MTTPPNTSTEATPDQKRTARIEVIARGLLICDGHVLVCRDRAGDYVYLPGGHVEPGESSADALVRELNEEAGLERVGVGACVLVTEQRFTQKGKARHEINIVFHVEHCFLPDLTPLPLAGWRGAQIDVQGEMASVPESETGRSARPNVASREAHIELHWVEAAALAELDLRPKSIKAWLMTARQTGGVDGSGLDRPNWLSESNL